MTGAAPTLLVLLPAAAVGLHFWRRTDQGRQALDALVLKVPLVQIRGEWIELRSQDIEAAIEFFQKNTDREMTLAEALRLSLA